MPALPPRTYASPGKAQFSGHMPTRFIRRKEVCHPTGLSPSSVYLLMNQNKFPTEASVSLAVRLLPGYFRTFRNGSGSASLQPVNRPATPR